MRGVLCLLALAGALVLTSATRADDETPGRKLKQFNPGRIFDKIDANGDGKVSKAEFKKFLEAMAEKAGKGGKAAQFADRIFEKLDGNGDDHLSKEEFAKLRGLGEKLKGKGGDLKERLREKLKGRFGKREDPAGQAEKLPAPNVEK